MAQYLHLASSFKTKRKLSKLLITWAIHVCVPFYEDHLLQ